MFVDGLVVLLNGIPFIDRDDNALAALMCDSGDLSILLSDTLCRIDHDHDNMCTLYCCHSTDHAVTLDLFFDLAFAAESCGVDKDVFFALPFDFGIDGISCSSCNIGYDHTVLTKQTVDQGRLTYVRFTYNSDLRNVVVLFCVKSFREFLDDLIQHITKSGTVGCGDRYRFSDTKVIKFINVHHIFLNAVYLVYNKNDRFLAAAQHICNLRIRIHKSLLYICDKYDNIGSVDRNLCLLSHLRKNDVTAVRLNSASIDHGKGFVQPCHISINSVTGHTRCIFYNRYHFACQGVKQRGFADIRPAHYCYYWFAHTFVSLSVFYSERDPVQKIPDLPRLPLRLRFLFQLPLKHHPRSDHPEKHSHRF